MNTERMTRSLPDGDYEVTVDGISFALRLITRQADTEKYRFPVSRVLMVISSSQWYRKTDKRWCSFAFYEPPYKLVLWKKFRGTKKRGRDWDAIAEAFRLQVIDLLKAGA